MHGVAGGTNVSAPIHLQVDRSGIVLALALSAPEQPSSQRKAKLRRVPDDGSSVVANFSLRPGEAESGFSLRLLLDTVLVECFAAGGRGVASVVGPPVALSAAALFVSADAEGVRLMNASVWQMQPIM